MDFLEKLYHNGIMPSEENNRPQYLEYKELSKQLHMLQEQLFESLNPAQRILFEKLMAVKLHIHTYEMGLAYSNGFRLGGRFITEIYKDIK